MIGINFKLNNIAVIDRNQTHSYRKLFNYIQKTVSFLNKLNLNKQDRIILLGNNSIEIIVLIFALNRLGIIFSIVDTHSNSKKLKHIFNDIEAKAIFIDEKIYNLKKDLINEYFNNVIINDMLLTNIEKYQEYQDVLKYKDDDIASIIYTSGSTGFPKGVVVLNKNINFSVEQIQKRLQYKQSDKILCGLDFSFDYGLYQIFLAFNVSATLVLKENYDNLLDVPAMLYKHKITIFPIVPTIIDTLLISRLLERVELKSLRMITSTGDTLSVTTIKKLQHILPNIEIVPMYGITECKRVAIMPKGMLDKKLGSVGKPLDDIEVYLNNDGELIVKGKNVTAGYWRDENLTKEGAYFEIKNDKKILHTGDYFKEDSDGYLYFIGRKDDLIKINSNRISIKEIERLLKETFCDIHEVAVGYKNGLYIFIFAKKDINKNKVIRFIKDDFNINLKDIFIQKNALAKNSNGKIDKNELFKQYLSR